MAREADVPQQTPQEDVAYPQERGALYDLPKISPNDLVGEVIDILGFHGPFLSSFKSASGKDKHYVLFRFKCHAPLKYVADDGTKQTLGHGEEAYSSGSALRVIERMQKVGKAEGEEALHKTLRALFAEEKTSQGYKVRTLKVPPSDWSCSSCGAQGPQQQS